MVSGATPEEFQKSLGASLLASVPLLSFDNMVQPLGGQTLCMVIDQEKVNMRLLGLLTMMLPVSQQDGTAGDAEHNRGNSPRGQAPSSRKRTKRRSARAG